VTPACLDKNYTKNEVEILDSRGEVIFQLKILSDHVEIQGEWRDEFGNGMRLSTGGGGRGGDITLWRTPEKEQETMKIIKPDFKYPSSLHLGELN
jgi:hypothetical protein